MIVPMKKVAVLVQSKDADQAVTRLRSLSVLHVEHHQPPESKDINLVQDDIASLNSALAILAEVELAKTPFVGSSKEPPDFRLTAKHIIDLRKRMEQLQEYAQSLKNKIELWQRWEDFDPDEIIALAKKGVFIKLYEIPLKQMKDLPASVVVKKIFTFKGITGCVVLSRQEFNLPFREVGLPKMSLERMRGRLSEDKRLIATLKNELGQHLCYRESLLRIKKHLEKELEFHQALQGMGKIGQIMYLSGYVPDDTVKLLHQYAQKERWGLVVSEPSPEDRVPTLIRNPRWISLISPLFKVLAIVPGYRELDISLWFLIFFSLFFGMLIGDAGYGLIFFFLTFLAQRRWGRKVSDNSVFILFYILSTLAIVWGILSATFFGQEWLPRTFQPLIPALRNERSVQTLCFLLGATHLSIAHLWRGMIKLPSLSALAEMGWILILWGAFYLAKLLILGERFPFFGQWFFLIGASLVILFSNPRKNVVKGIASGLGNLLLNLMNNFTDVVSYIRLFAVGLATVAVADSFNKMAQEVGFNDVFTGIATSLILLLGHLLNIVLAPMAVLVHGVRLNVLEFCNHLDIKWSGFSYQPLGKGIDSAKEE